MRKQNNNEKSVQEPLFLRHLSIDVLNDRMQRIPESINSFTELIYLRKQLEQSAERRHDDLMEEVSTVRSEMAKHAKAVSDYQKYIHKLHIELEEIANILKERQNEN